MTFQLKWDPKVQRSLGKLPYEVSQRIVEKIKQVIKNPFHYLEHFEGDSCYKLRIGDYRALVDIDFETKILKIRTIDKRSRIYKR